MTHDRTILIISQVYVPDPAAVGQYFHDAAAMLAQRGNRVVVLTSERGYENPSQRYPRQEIRDQVRIIRLPWSSFGKRSIAHRLLGQALFLIQAILQGLFMPRLGSILVSTSPPMASIAALVIGTLRRRPIQFWVMDVNPDQVVAMGKLAPTSLAVRLFNRLNRAMLRHARKVIVLDRFMGQRMNAKCEISDKLEVLGLWPLETIVEPVSHRDNPFRDRHSLQNQLVFMYSGNMTPASPLDTLLAAALKVQDDPRLRFLFVGGGLGKKTVEQIITQHKPKNMFCLPYQPLADLQYSLSAADIHMVTLGANMVGIIHPSKVYGAMAVARPLFYVGPKPSHISDLIEQHRIGWRVDHGDVDGAVRVIRQIAATSPEELADMGQRALRVVREQFSKDQLCTRFAQMIEADQAK